MQNNSVKFKGMKDGLFVMLDEGYEFDQIINELREKLELYRCFFKNANTNIIIKGKQLTDVQFEEVKGIIIDKAKLDNVDIIHSEKEFHHRSNGSKQQTLAKNVEPKIPFEQEGSVKIIRSTVRNGQRITYDGHIVIIGDVNPGAELMASGSIMVMGSLRGMAHAGILGNNESIVSAFYLQPTQLRISNIITRPPDDDLQYPDTPELAYVKDGHIVIEPFGIIRKNNKR